MMHRPTAERVRHPILALAALAALASIGCGGAEPTAPPVATPTLTLSHERAPAGSPLELTYRFDVAEGAQFDQDYRVMLHVVDLDGERMWGDDHDPPVPTTSWQPGATVQYTRTIFVPVFPYVGEATLNVGLYSARDQTRLPLAGEHVGQLAYRVGRLQLLPQTDNLVTVFKDGWYPTEGAPDNVAVEWQWTRGEATLAFRNPKKDATLYLELDSPGGEYHGPQQVSVSSGAQVVDDFTLAPRDHQLRKIALPAAALGEAEMAELTIRVDKPFIPAAIPEANNKDGRELGVRVFHAFVDAR